jgi:hypothetical protein
MQLNTTGPILLFCVVSCNGRFNASHLCSVLSTSKDTVFLVQVSDVGQIWTIKFLSVFHFAGFKGKVGSSKISSKNWRNWNDKSSLAAELPSGFCTVRDVQWNSWTLPLPRLTRVSDHIISCYCNWSRNKKPSVIHSKYILQWHFMWFGKGKGKVAPPKGYETGSSRLWPSHCTDYTTLAPESHCVWNVKKYSSTNFRRFYSTYDDSWNTTQTNWTVITGHWRGGIGTLSDHWRETGIYQY